jgi:hypothetical protein
MIMTIVYDDHLRRERRLAIATVTKVMSEFLASRNY